MLPMPSVKVSCLFITWHSVLLSHTADLSWHQRSQSRLFMLRSSIVCGHSMYKNIHGYKLSIQLRHSLREHMHTYIYTCVYIIYDGHDIYKNVGQTNVKPTPHARLQHINMSTPGMIKPQLVKHHIKLHAQHMCVCLVLKTGTSKKSLQWISKMLTKWITHLYWWTVAFSEKTAKKRPNKNKYVNKHEEKKKRGSQDKMKAKYHTSLNSRCTRGVLVNVLAKHAHGLGSRFRCLLLVKITSSHLCPRSLWHE